MSRSSFHRPTTSRRMACMVGTGIAGVIVAVSVFGPTAAMAAETDETTDSSVVLVAEAPAQANDTVDLTIPASAPADAPDAAANIDIQSAPADTAKAPETNAAAPATDEASKPIVVVDPPAIVVELPAPQPEVPADTTAPTVTIKPEGPAAVNDYRKLISFKLFDAGKIDKVVLNGVEKDLSNNVWSDLNGVKPGVFGAVQGLNTLVVYDVAGNTTTVTFYLDTLGPTLEVKPESKGKNGIYLNVSYKLHDKANVDKLFVNGVEKNLTDNPWSDLNGLTAGVFGGVEGLNTIVTVDGLGNQSTYTVIIDTTKAVITLPETGTAKGSHTFHITQVEANPDWMYAEVQQMVDGKWKKVSGEYFYGVNVADYVFDTTQLVDGLQTQLKVTSRDLAGNNTSAVEAFEVENCVIGEPETPIDPEVPVDPELPVDPTDPVDHEEPAVIIVTPIEENGPVIPGKVDSQSSDTKGETTHAGASAQIDTLPMTGGNWITTAIAALIGLTALGGGGALRFARRH